MPRLLKAVLLTAFLIFSPPAAQAAQFRNGDFMAGGSGGNPFAYWNTTTAFPADMPTFLSSTTGGALFTEGSLSVVQLEQTFTLPAGMSKVQFDVLISSTLDGSGVSPGTFPPDSFQATLYDLGPSGSDFIPFGSPDPPFPAYYSIDNTLTEYYSNTLVTVTSLGGGTQRVSLDLTSYTPSGDVLIEFILNSGPDGLHTTALLSNVILVPQNAPVAIPEPGAMVLLGTGLASVLAWRRPWRSRKS